MGSERQALEFKQIMDATPADLKKWEQHLQSDCDLTQGQLAARARVGQPGGEAGGACPSEAGCSRICGGRSAQKADLSVWVCCGEGLNAHNAKANAHKAAGFDKL